MSKLRIAVVGAGHLGRIHARLLAERDDVLLVGIVDPDPAAREQAARELGVPSFSDHHALFEQVDGVILATPTSTHHAVALEFLNRGLPVLVEKPLAGSVREADELVAAARRRNTVLQVGHIERFNPALAAARPFLTGPRFIEAVRAGSFSARSTDIGVVLDLMIHDIDIMLTLVGARVRSVYAQGLALLGRHEDVAHARFEFENGCVAQLSASRVSSAAARRQMHVWGERALVDIDFGARTASIVCPSEAVLRHELDVETMSPDERLQFRDRLHEEHLKVVEAVVPSRNAMADEQLDFLECVRTARTPQVSGADGRDALVVAERVLAAIQSHAWSERANAPAATAGTAAPILRGPHWQLSEQAARSRRAS